MSKHIAIAGAGPVGCLLSIYLLHRGYRVSVFERRADMRESVVDAGRSINLALSNRGLRPLRELGIAESLNDITIPMHGRMMHDAQGRTTFLAYGKQGQYINSISRSALNISLINEAEKDGADFHFLRRISDVDPDRVTMQFESGPDVNADIIIGADGGGSAVRNALARRGHVSISEEFIEHGYKELSIHAGPRGFLFETNALHIWPRESFMLIALPNPDRSFTCTLFLPFKGRPSFEDLGVPVLDFFEKEFPDALAVMPDLSTQWSSNPVSGLGTVKCRPWSENKVLLIGDAAHAVVPFYGQGMNAGFEDCRILNKLLDDHGDDWSKAIAEYESERKPDADAIAKLALDNFVEMRDLVADAGFLLQKKIEAKLHELFPARWIPLYSMVTFQDDIRYSDALKTGDRQKKIMREVMMIPGIEASWQALDFASIVSRLDQ